ncbi:hypothetical protein BDR03DRAFT_1017438 [Suillus americanus]|nr:hypothetical protein BDR03DRAFT_1017438 [Suillus americanus]
MVQNMVYDKKQPPAEEVQLDHKDLSCDFPYDTEQPTAAISSPPLDCDNSRHHSNSDYEEWSNDFSYEADNSVLTMDNDLPCSCNTLTLQTLKTLVGKWWKDWGSKGMWNEAFNDALRGEVDPTGGHPQCRAHALSMLQGAA